MKEESPKSPKSPEPSFYETVCGIDVIDPIMHLVQAGTVYVDRKTQKFKMRRTLNLRNPWTLAKVCKDRRCGKWTEIYFECFHILPPPCKQCWKVVFAPRTVVELIELQKVQAQMALPSKCGLENRDYTSGLGGYRAFWYCDFYGGLEKARKHYKRIKETLIKHFSEDYILKREEEGRLYLKRGCTEFERDFGNSDKWDSIDHSAKFNLLEAVWEDYIPTPPFSPMTYTNYKRWIEHAIAHGDTSALIYVKGDSLGISTVKYNESEHRDEDFKPSIVSLNETIEKGQSLMEDKDAVDSRTKKKESLLESLNG